MIGLLPAATLPEVLKLCPPEPKICNVPPIVGGFQMPLPGFSGRDTDIEAEQSLDWHCYLGSK
jgi:hypothetical protein